MNTFQRGFALGLGILIISGAVRAAAPVHQWSQRFGGTDRQTARVVTADASQNVIITGWFRDTVDFGGGNLATAGQTDIFIVKFDANGAHQWSQRFGDASDDLGTAVAVDASGNVIVTGYFYGTVNFGGGDLTSEAASDVFIVKFDANGAHQWSQRFGGTGSDVVQAVAVDASGNVIVTGYFWDTANFGGDDLTSSGRGDIFIAKFDANGAHQWSQRFGDASIDYGMAVGVDSQDNVILTGSFNGTVDFGGGDLTSAGFQDIFIAKYDANATHLWSLRFGDTSEDIGMAVGVDSQDNVILTGNFIGTVDFGGGNLTSAGARDIFIAKYDASATHLWSLRFGDFGSDSGSGVTTDASDNTIITGYFQYTVDFGGGDLTSAGLSDIFVVKYDASGVHQWSQRFGDSGTEVGQSITVDALDNLIVTGEFTDTVNFGGGSMTSAGDFDIFLVKFHRPRTWYILPDSTGDAPTIQAGIDSAIAGDTVLVGCGTYTDIAYNDMKSGVILRSETGFPDCATIEGNTWDPIMYCDGDSTTRIEGLTFRRGEESALHVSGNPTFSRCVFSDNWDSYGGGGAVESDGAPAFVDCDFIGNQSFGGGGAIVGSVSSLIRCRFVDNQTTQTSGGAFSGWATLVSECVFEDNQAYFSAGAVVGFVDSLVNCVFSRNEFRLPFNVPEGGAVILQGPSYIAGCTFENNIAPGASLEQRSKGGAIYAADSLVIHASVFSSNVAGTGAAVYAPAGAVISDCTFYGNSADSTTSPPGGTLALGAGSTVENTILAFAVAGAAVDSIDGCPFLVCSDVFGNADGDWVGCIAVQDGTNSNFSTNPLFCDPDNGDFTVALLSDCMWLNNECGVQIGAKGPGCNTPTGIDTDAPPVPTSLRVSAHPNPFNPQTTINYSLPNAGPVNVSIYDVAGRLVGELVAENKPAGEHSVDWTGRDNVGGAVSSGVYFVRLQFGNDVQTRKLVLLK